MEKIMRSLHVLLFVLATCFAVSYVCQAQTKAEDKPPYSLTDVELDKKLGIEEKTELPKEYIWVVYFHRVPGCDTCQLMSKYIYETVEKQFSDDVKGKKIVLRFQNFEDRKNAALVQKLGIKSPSLAIIQIKDGKLVKAKLAGQIWSLAAEKEKFVDYVEKEIKAYIPGSTQSLKADSSLASTSEQIVVDFLYLDLDTCERCVATDDALKESLDTLSGVFNTLKRPVIVNTVNITSKELAAKYRFVSSPTIRVNGVDICKEVKESDCKDCGDLCGDRVDCRVFVYEGKEYEQPPAAMIVDGILQVVYKQQLREDDIAYTMPDNLERFFAGKSSCCDSGCCASDSVGDKAQCCPQPNPSAQCCPQSAQCCETGSSTAIPAPVRRTLMPFRR